ncbi:MAG: ATP synthase F1 subunit delta [Planctomycetes bacterium]|nr:ATP synthase F1 subunit delta [Planctomycetota bacterium]
MITGAVTTRYTEALFALATEQGAVDAVRSDVERLAAEVADEHVAAWLFDARVPTGDKRAKVAQVTASFHPLTRNFVSLLFDKHREEVLRGLGTAFRHKWLESRGAVEGWVESARPLGSGEVSELAVAIGAKVGKEVLLENRVNPDLVAGVRVFVANKLIDFSVRGRLKGLERTLMESPLPSAS